VEESKEAYSVNWRCLPNSDCGGLDLIGSSGRTYQFIMDTTSSNSATYCLFQGISTIDNVQDEFTVKLVGIPLPFSIGLVILLAITSALVMGTFLTLYFLEKAEERKRAKENAKMEVENDEDYGFGENIFA
jgi:uncharacterized phage infection (PIP) family protein YhgE